MRSITIKTIPHNDQAYETPGNWRFDQYGDLLVEVSDMGNWKYQFLVALHEMVEVALCKERNIPQAVVDDFDVNYEKERAEGKHRPEDEPGDDPAAPYRKEHFFATNIERLMAGELGVDWEDYDRAVMSLGQVEKTKP